MKLLPFSAVLAILWMSQIVADEFAIEAKRPDAQSVDIQLEIRGKLVVAAGDQDDEGELPMEVDGRFSYIERNLRSSKSTRALRHYKTAEAKIDLGKGQMISRLSDDNRWLIADRRNDNKSGKRVRFLTSTSGLGQKELELVNIPANTIVWDQALAVNQIALGGNWTPSDELFADALAVDRIRENNATCRLAAVDSGVATIRITGSITADVDDADTEMQIDATCKFNLAGGFTQSLDLTIDETRSVSGSAPGFHAITKLNLNVDRSVSWTLSDIANQGLDKKRWTDYLTFSTADNQISLRYDRRWRMIRSEADYSIFRFIDHGLLLAQINLEPRPRLPSVDSFTLEAFKKEVHDKTAETGTVVDAKAWKTDRGLSMMCVTVNGTDSDVNVVWRYYHLAQADGLRVSAIATCDAEVADELGDADRRFLESITITLPKQARADEVSR